MLSIGYIFVFLILFIVWIAMRVDRWEACQSGQCAGDMENTGILTETPAPQPQTGKMLLKELGIKYLFIFLFCATFCIAETEARWGDDSFFFIIVLFFAFLILLVMIFIFLNIIALIFFNRTKALMRISYCLIYIFSCFFWGLVSQKIEGHALRAFTERSKPLIAGIKAFQADHQRPPEKLEDLVPTYLPKIPKTGFGYEPDYHYIARTEYAPHEWMIWISRSPGFCEYSVSYSPHAGVDPDDWNYY